MCRGVRCTDSRCTPSSLILARPRCARRSRLSFLLIAIPTFSQNLLGLLGFLAQNRFIGVLHTLTLVGFRRPVRANLRRYLTDALLVHPFDNDLGLTRRLDGDPLRNREIHRMRKTQGKVECFALHLSTVTDAVDLEFALKARG